MSILVIDLGTSGVRAAIVGADASVTHEFRSPTLPDSPAPGLVEFDANAYAAAALDCARSALDAHGPVDAVGVTNQRGSTIVWDRATGEPLAPAQGWQDLRTVGDCLVLAADGIRLAPNQSATKLANILDAVDPDRTRDLCFGTPDSWIVWKLTEGAHHVSDLTNAAIWGLLSPDGSHYDVAVMDRLRIPASVLPRIVDSSGPIGEATALPGAPMVCGVAGDQQASLIGQGCVRPGSAKITFGTGGMLDVCVGPQPPTVAGRAGAGTFPIVCWRLGQETVWGVEAVMLSAGTNVEWLVEDLGVLERPEDSGALAASVPDADGVVYVPALLGLGTPRWDYGARGTLLGLTRGSGRAHVVRAVLEGVAERGADLVDAAEADAGVTLSSLRIDGGMSDNDVFVQHLADATQRPVEVSPVREATALGAGFLAGLAIGTWSGWDHVADTWTPSRRVEPGTPTDRDRWREALDRAAGWHEDLSALDF
ncbi:MAG: glycerol kinase [Microthrixaceae bacterium]|nr:glycerol kinase [Microthrixaceae bacterium]